MNRLDTMTRTVLRHRALVIVLWCCIGLAGLLASTALPGRLTALTAVPGSPSAAADAVLRSSFGDNTDGSFTVIVHFRQASDARIRQLEQELTDAVRVVPTATVVQQRALGGVLYALVGTRLPLLDASAATDRLRASLRAHGLDGALVTGAPALEHDVRPVLADDLHRGTVLAVVAALLLLLLVLGWCWAVLVPFVVAAAVVAGSLLLVYAVTLITPMVLYIPNVIELIGLGLAIDYALLLVHRFRAEVRARQGDGTDAVVRTMATAGRTVIISGITAAVGLSVLFLTPVPFVRSLGAAGLIVPVVSILAALTLQPVLLALLGERGVQARGWHGVLDDARADARWARLAALVARRPRTVVVTATLGLAVVALPVLGIHLAPASLTAIPQQLESARGVDFLAARVGAGAITPHSLVIDTGRPGGAVTGRDEQARTRLASALTHLPGVFAVVSDTSTLFVDATQRYQRMVIIGRDGFADAGTAALIDRLRAIDPQQYGYAPGASVMVGGASARGVDFLRRIEGATPWIVIASLLLAYLLMARAFRTRLLPAVAVGLNLVSVTAACGVVVLVFQVLLHQSTIEAWALVFLFAMLFGLSMDYQVFIVARIREARLQGRDAVAAIGFGLERTAGVITAAALILVAALTGLVTGHVTGLQELGVGLVAGVIIDAAVVRTLLLPGVLVLLGERAWGGGVDHSSVSA